MTDKIERAAEKAKGKLTEVTGEVLNDEEMADRGRREQRDAKAEDAKAHAKDAVADAAETVKRSVD